jgi:hypothetical protein
MSRPALIFLIKRMSHLSKQIGNPGSDSGSGSKKQTPFQFNLYTKTCGSKPPNWVPTQHNTGPMQWPICSSVPMTFIYYLEHKLAISKFPKT